MLAWDKIGTPIMAHIHRGGRNDAGPVVVLFFMGTPKKAACVDAPHSLVKEIAKKPKRFYVNIPTTPSRPARSAVSSSVRSGPLGSLTP